jgi:hypothetical protein
MPIITETTLSQDTPTCCGNRVSNDAVKEPVFSPDAVPYEWHPEMSQSGRDPDKASQPS